MGYCRLFDFMLLQFFKKFGCHEDFHLRVALLCFNGLSLNQLTHEIRKRNAFRTQAVD
jgi:hypothetical protein